MTFFFFLFQKYCHFIWGGGEVLFFHCGKNTYMRFYLLIRFLSVYNAVLSSTCTMLCSRSLELVHLAELKFYVHFNDSFLKFTDST